jgi:hypothetical protein
MNMTIKNSYRINYLGKSDWISAALGLSGSIYLAAGNSLIAQVLFCLANPILAYNAWKAGSKPSSLLFSAYEFFAFVGIFKGMGWF